MPLNKCARCGKLFTKVKNPVCPKCEPGEEADYELIRQALEETPNQTAEQLASTTEVALPCVMRLVDDGRVATAPTGKIRCGRCGAPAISMSKKLCEACLHKLESEVARAQAGIKLTKKKGVEVGTAMNVRKWLNEKK
jgi:ribosomal protein L37E